MRALDSERASWFAHWRELSENILPRRGPFVGTASQLARGAKLNGKLLDSTAMLAARTLASGLMAGLTSPARPWFRLGLGSPAISAIARGDAGCGGGAVDQRGVPRPQGERCDMGAFER